MGVQIIGINLSDQRIMPRYNELRFGCQSLELVKTVKHILQVHHDGKGLASQKIFVEMRRIRGEHQPTRIRPYPDGLKATAVTPYCMHGNPVGDFTVPIVESDLPGIEPLDRLAICPAVKGILSTSWHIQGPVA